MKQWYKKKLEWSESQRRAWSSDDEFRYGKQVILTDEQINAKNEKWESSCKERQKLYLQQEEQHESNYRKYLWDKGEEWNYFQYHYLKQIGKI